MPASVAFMVALIAEGAALFAIWRRSALGSSPAWLERGLALGVVGLAALSASAASLPPRAYAAFPAMYLAASLAWSWKIDGVTPDKWTARHLAAASVATILFSFANSGWGQRWPL